MCIRDRVDAHGTVENAVLIEEIDRRGAHDEPVGGVGNIADLFHGVGLPLHVAQEGLGRPVSNTTPRYVAVHDVYDLSLIHIYICILVFMIPLGISSADLGLPTVMNASRSFGIGGSRVIVSIIIAISMVGWFGFQAKMCIRDSC